MPSGSSIVSSWIRAVADLPSRSAIARAFELVRDEGGTTRLLAEMLSAFSDVDLAPRTPTPREMKLNSGPMARIMAALEAGEIVLAKDWRRFADSTANMATAGRKLAERNPSIRRERGRLWLER